MVVTNHQAGNDKMAQKTVIDKHKTINTKEERLALLALLVGRYSWAGAEVRSSATYQTNAGVSFLMWGGVCKWVGSEITAS